MNQSHMTHDSTHVLRGILDQPNSFNMTPFFVATLHNNIDLATLLLDDGMSDIDQNDTEGDTPLHWAVVLN